MDKKLPAYVTVMIIPDGAEARRGLRIRAWVLKMIVFTLVVILIGIVVFFSLYGKVLTQAARADILTKENEQLRRYHHKVQLLQENLKQAREVVGRLTELAGIDYEFPEFPNDSTLFASLEAPAVAVLSRPRGPDLNWPAGLPIPGFISQDFEIEDPTHYHPGIDIACAEGTPVLATAAGVVIYAAFDSTYGNLIVIQHSDTVTTLYGHNQELLAEPGQKISTGSRIALSGNTGISTAPHLHYEVRVNEKPINPLEQKYDGKE